MSCVLLVRVFLVTVFDSAFYDSILNHMYIIILFYIYLFAAKYVRHYIPVHVQCTQEFVVASNDKERLYDVTI